ncbi:MAG: sensor histidine kinase [Lachnospiraceae bacterium]|jgi:two-component system sensor histidine kinase YesM|nr:sensor histidine kinase [Lachnospiraceae bacterium]
MRRMNYLSVRILVLSAAGVISFLLFICLVMLLVGSEPLWLFILALAVVLFLSLLGYYWVFLPYRRGERFMRLFLEGYTTMGLEGAFQVSPTPSGHLLVERLMEMMDSSELLKLNKRQAQYLALQNQINPHFLYNTLESIRSEALIAGLNSVAEMTEALATFFRYTISKVENLVSVEEELQNCETYFRIQQYRFGERLSLTVECDPEDRDEIYRCRLPKLTMQPILENSIIHGTECKIGSGHLTIHLERSGRRLFIRISDDGCGMDERTLTKMNERLQKSGRAFGARESETRGGIALVNVNNRIHLLYGEEYGLHVFSMPGLGTDVEITLPAITSDREVKNKEALK